jgi:hypothetical protein
LSGGSEETIGDGFVDAGVVAGRAITGGGAVGRVGFGCGAIGFVFVIGCADATCDAVGSGVDGEGAVNGEGGAVAVVAIDAASIGDFGSGSAVVVATGTTVGGGGGAAPGVYTPGTPYITAPPIPRTPKRPIDIHKSGRPRFGGRIDASRASSTSCADTPLPKVEASLGSSRTSTGKS